LCLLAQTYEHASHVVFKFADFEITVNTLMEIDKLVQLLESPIFLFLRLHLLEPSKYSFLYKTLYGLLMLLPQKAAFETLKNRLASVTAIGVLQLMSSKSIEEVSDSSALGIDFGILLDHFVKVRKKHDQKLRARLEEDRKAPLIPPKSRVKPKHSHASSSTNLRTTKGLPAQKSNYFLQQLQLQQQKQQPQDTQHQEIERQADSKPN